MHAKKLPCFNQEREVETCNYASLSGTKLEAPTAPRAIGHRFQRFAPFVRPSFRSQSESSSAKRSVDSAFAGMTRSSGLAARSQVAWDIAFRIASIVAGTRLPSLGGLKPDVVNLAC